MKTIPATAATVTTTILDRKINDATAGRLILSQTLLHIDK
jgi:hypothetical protein